MVKVDIEKILQWALREELPKGHPVAASTWETTVERFAFLGTRVDVSCAGSPDGLGYVPGEPHPDAVLVGAAIRKLPRNYKLLEYECRALLGYFAKLDPLAVRALAKAEFNMPALVIRCAVLGQRMPWDLGHPQAKPQCKYDRGGAIAFYRSDDGLVREAKANTRGNYPLGSSTPLEWHEPSVGQLLEARAEYAIWHRAISMLFADLSGSLREREILPPVARAEPWRTGQAPDAVVRVRKSTAVDNLDVLPIKPVRPRARRPIEAQFVIAKRREAAKERAEARKAMAQKKADAV